MSTKSDGPEDPLPTSLYLVLALLAEGEAHGYKLESLIRNRGFRYWTDIGRSSLYQALSRLESAALVSSRFVEGRGPVKKVFSITDTGKERLRVEAIRRLERPLHPRNEIDLGIYALPFLTKEDALKALAEGKQTLNERAAFLEERLAWCRERGMRGAALNFERPLAAMRAELLWLERLEEEFQAGLWDDIQLDWPKYEYSEPPGSDFV